MDFLKRLTVLFLVTINLFICAIVGLYLTGVLDQNQVLHWVRLININYNYHLGAWIFAGVLFFFNFLMYRLFTANVRKHKIIAFDNPSGRVMVSLAALEDMIKRLLMKSPEIKEAKTNIFVFRKKLYVRTHLTLLSDVNIPALVGRLQQAITRKIQDAIGLEETIEVNVYVGKIFALEGGERSKIEKDKLSEPLPPTNIPYHGYRP